MEDVDEHHHIEAGIGKGNAFAVEPFDGNTCPGANQDIDPLNSDVRAALLDEMGGQPVSTPHIEDPRSIRNERRKPIAQHADAPSVDELVVEAVGQRHLRCIPKMLTKKLASTV